MIHYTVKVGSTVVAAFHQVRAAHKFVQRNLAPGCKPNVQKSHYTTNHVVAKHCSNAARQVTTRQTTNRVGNLESYPRPMRPGEFVL